LYLRKISSRKREISWSPFAQALNLRRQEQGQEAGEWREHQAVPEPPLATALIAEKEAGQKMTSCQSSSPGIKQTITLDDPKGSVHTVIKLTYKLVHINS
jgi:hypothetical protein